MIAAVIPYAGCGNTGSPVVLVADNFDAYCRLPPRESQLRVPSILSLAKKSGHDLNWYIVEQLPVIAPGDYDRQFGNTTARELVRDHVLRLTYTSHDMAPFARDLGHAGPPFTWDEEERRHLRARLDALYFHLYGLDRDDAGYVLGTFPIVRRQDEAQFGRYRTRDLILAYMNALSAGDAETVVAV